MFRFRVCGSYFDRLSSYDAVAGTADQAITAFKANICLNYWDEQSIHVINFDVPAVKAYDRIYQENVPWQEGRKYEA